MRRSLLVTRDLFGWHLRWAAGGWTTMAIVGALFLVPSLTGAGPGPQRSMWGYSGAGSLLPLGFLAVIGTQLSMIHLPVYLANGLTRRQVLLGGLIFAPLASALWTVVAVAGYGVEYAIYSAEGLTVPHPTASFAAAARLTALFAPTALTYLLSGWLLGSAWFRFGLRRGSLFLPVAAIPGLGVEIVFGHGWVRAVLRQLFGAAPPADAPAPVVALLVLACAALAFAGVHAFVRAMPVPPRPIGY